MLYSGNPSHIQGYTYAQNKGMEKDLLSKWKAKKKAEVAILVSDKIDLNQQRSKETKKGIT